jgi:hypothetical protein
VSAADRCEGTPGGRLQKSGVLLLEDAMVYEEMPGRSTSFSPRHAVAAVPRVARGPDEGERHYVTPPGGRQPFRALKAN